MSAAGFGGGGFFMGRRGKRGARRRPAAEINVTPIVDVVFVLLIVFMISAPLLTSGVEVNLPNSQAKALVEDDIKPLEVTVNREGKVFLGEEEIQEGNLLPMLSAMSEGNKDINIYIRGDESLAYGKVMEVLGLINGAGYTRVALVSENK